MKAKLRRNLIVLLLLGMSSLLFAPMPSFAKQEQEAPGLELARQAVKTEKKTTTADHSQFKALQQAFTSGPQISKACISCHTKAADQLNPIHQRIIKRAKQDIR